ncbi:MAG: hypothetical protein ACI4IQ_02600 [Eubacterium sp.]
MACFLVPAAEAIVVTAALVAVKKKEQKIEAPKLADGNKLDQAPTKISWSKKLTLLAGLLWGGILLLAFEHIWHGEIVPFAPFLTAMSDPDSKVQMLSEMSTVGVAMAATVTAVWGAICAVADAKMKKIKSKLVSQKA